MFGIQVGTAEIDQEKTEIFRADYLFRAINIQKGTHEIEFEYAPLIFYIAEGGNWNFYLIGSA